MDFIKPILEDLHQRETVIQLAALSIGLIIVFAATKWMEPDSIFQKLYKAFLIVLCGGGALLFCFLAATGVVLDYISRHQPN